MEAFRAERQDCANLLLRIEGLEPAAEPVLLGAHYDSTAELSEGWDRETDPAPGADDDASGVAVLLEAARVLGAWEGSFRRPIEVVLFSAEEQGLKGSIHHVEQRATPVHVALILDPVGHNPGDADWLFVAYDSRWTEAAEALEVTALAHDLGLEVGIVDHETFGGDERSDHAPFWWAEQPALHAGTYPLPAAYHTTEDTLDGVDVDFVTAVARLTVAHAAERAGASEPEVEEPRRACSTVPAGLLASLLALSALRRRRP